MHIADDPAGGADLPPVPRPAVRVERLSVIHPSGHVEARAAACAKIRRAVGVVNLRRQAEENRCRSSRFRRDLRRYSALRPDTADPVEERRRHGQAALPALLQRRGYVFAHDILLLLLAQPDRDLAAQIGEALDQTCQIGVDLLAADTAGGIDEFRAIPSAKSTTFV